MAKRPRMGRNLDALLGGSTRERRSRPVGSPAASADDTVTGDTESVTLIDRENSSQLSTDGAAESQIHTVPGADTSVARGNDANAPGNSAPLQDKHSLNEDDGSAKSAVHSDSTIGRSASTADPQASAGATSRALPATPGYELARENAAKAIAGSNDRFRLLGVDQIQRGNFQPRRLFDQELLQELADSIQAEGLIQPIVVRPLEQGSDKEYELVAGERRWRAAQLAGMSEIPSIIRQLPDKSVAAVSVIENIQRKDLNPLEEAAAFERLCSEFGMTHKAVADSVGRSRAAVTNLMRLLELHDEVKQRVDRGELDMGHARALLAAPHEKQPMLAGEIIDQGLSVRAVEKRIRELGDRSDKPEARQSNTANDPDIERLRKKLGEKLGARVRIQHQRTGRGKLEINYASVAELQGILTHIK